MNRIAVAQELMRVARLLSSGYQGNYYAKLLTLAVDKYARETEESENEDDLDALRRIAHLIRRGDAAEAMKQTDLLESTVREVIPKEVMGFMQSEWAREKG